LNIVLLGPPGAGKGTQAKVLSREFKVLHVSTGDMLREAVEKGTEIGSRAKSYMDAGELVPDTIVIDLVIERISRDDAKKGFLLDGFPRNEEQADRLDASLEKAAKKLGLVLYFKTAPAVSLERLSGRRVCTACRENFHVKNMPPKKNGICDYCGGELVQRRDDTEETVKRRLMVYEKETKALINYYRHKGILREVSGDLDVNELFEEIKVLLASEKMA